MFFTVFSLICVVVHVDIFKTIDHTMEIFPWLIKIDLVKNDKCLCNGCEPVKLTPQVCNGPPVSTNS